MLPDRPGRPPVVTAVGALAMLYGVAAGFALFAAFGLLNPANVLEAIFFPMFLFIFTIIGLLGAGIFLVGLWTMRGSRFARNVLVVLLGLTAVVALAMSDGTRGLAFLAAGVNVAAAVALVAGPGGRWFRASP